MNANADLAQLAEVAERLRAEVLSPAVIAKATGHAVSTISRDRAEKDLIDWKARDLLLLARSCPELGRAIIAFLGGQPIEHGDPSAVPESLRQDARASAHAEVTIRDALIDGNLTCREIDRIRIALAQRNAANQALDLALRAARRTAKP